MDKLKLSIIYYDLDEVFYLEDPESFIKDIHPFSNNPNIEENLIHDRYDIEDFLDEDNYP